MKSGKKYRVICHSEGILICQKYTGSWEPIELCMSKGPSNGKGEKKKLEWVKGHWQASDEHSVVVLYVSN